jgi:hypothetical protein
MNDIFQKAKQIDQQDVFFKSIKERLHWTDNKCKRYIKRCSRMDQLAQFTSRGGCTMLSFHVIPTDIEDICQKEWDQYLHKIKVDKRLVHFLKHIMLTPNNTIPSFRS